MLTRDYLLRMISSLARVLAKVMLHKKAKQYDQAMEELQQAGKQLLGMNLLLLSSLSDEELIALLKLGERFDVEKCLAAAELLREQSEIQRLTGNENESARSAMKSLSLFTELVQYEKEALPQEYFEKIESLIQALSVFELPQSIQQKLFRYYELTGSYAKAEDVLFELVEQNASFLQDGIKFYDRLMKKTDDELAKGNLPRGEVKKSANELTKKI
ncbi:MAG: hypothetical protein HY276_03060 [Ignavibacteriales bacterium]|nr:hypothetical protein [Ignavibacteriales bacterium]